MKRFLNLDSISGLICFYLFQLAASFITTMLFMRMLIHAFMSLGGEEEWQLPLWLVGDLIATFWWALGSRRGALHVAAGLLVMVIGCILWLSLFF